MPQVSCMFDWRSVILPAWFRLRKGVTRAAMLIAVLSIRCYQGMIRPHLIGSCKFHPSCSEYGIEALQVHGILRGTILTVHRICRCHPFSAGGFDPVPLPSARRQRRTLE
jgi:putative membrane protein insertion efficiency factor